jgi:hypothetical protein
MLRILLYVAAVVALFGGAIVYGGNAIGAWDPLPPAPTPPPAVKVDRSKAKEGKKAGKPATALPAAATGRRNAAERAWVRKADALCRESRTGVQTIVAQAADAGTYRGGVALFARIRDYNKQMNDRFLALGVPASYRPQIAKVRALFAKEERLFDLMYKALQQNNMRQYFRLADRVTYVALDESDILASLRAYSCDVDFPSLFGDHY